MLSRGLELHFHAEAGREDGRDIRQGRVELMETMDAMYRESTSTMLTCSVARNSYHRSRKDMQTARMKKDECGASELGNKSRKRLGSRLRPIRKQISHFPWKQAGSSRSIPNICPTLQHLTRLTCPLRKRSTNNWHV